MEPYRDSSDEAFDRMFERDKDDLRALGIPLETGYVDKFFEDEPGYRIKRDAFELPAIDFAAGRGRRARPGGPGVAPRRAGRRDLRRPGQAQGGRAQLRPGAARPGRSPRWPPRSRPSRRCSRPRSTARRCSSTTAGPARRDATTRHVQPWGVVTAQGRWYVAGLDTDRGEPRMFRLSRIISEVRPTGAPGSFTVPEDTDLRALSGSLRPARARPHRGRAGPHRGGQRPAPAGRGQRRPA